MKTQRDPNGLTDHYLSTKIWLQAKVHCLWLITLHQSITLSPFITESILILWRPWFDRVWTNSCTSYFCWTKLQIQPLLPYHLMMIYKTNLLVHFLQVCLLPSPTLSNCELKLVYLYLESTIFIQAILVPEKSVAPFANVCNCSVQSTVVQLIIFIYLIKYFVSLLMSFIHYLIYRNLMILDIHKHDILNYCHAPS